MPQPRPVLNLAKRSSRRLDQKLERAVARLLPAKPAMIKLNRAIVSFTFDDVPQSAISNGARLLNQAELNGTFYMCGGLCGADFSPWTGYAREDVSNLVEAGHEIGCHTFSHPDVQTLSAKQLKAETAKNTEWFTTMSEAIQLTNFAFPYGSTGIRQKMMLSRNFASCRGVVEGLNQGFSDLGQLRAFRLYDHLFSRQTLENLVQKAIEKRAWLIFYTHDVQTDATEHGCTPGFFEKALKTVTDADCDVLTVHDALQRINA